MSRPRTAVFPAIPTITPFATGCSNVAPNATYPLKDELGECRKFTGLDLPLTRLGERVRDRRSEPPHDRLNRLISAAHAERDRSFEVRAELGMNRSNPDGGCHGSAPSQSFEPAPPHHPAAGPYRPARRPPTTHAAGRPAQRSRFGGDRVTMVIGLLDVLVEPRSDR